MRRAIALTLIIVQLLAAPTVLAADPDVGPTTYGSTSVGEGPSTDAFVICVILAEIRKNSSTSIGARGWQDCEGALIFNQTLEVYVDRCTFAFPPGNCITWTQHLFLRRCSVDRGGLFLCPASGAFLNVNGVGQGQYKTRVMGTVRYDGGSASGSDESPSVYLP